MPRLASPCPTRAADTSAAPRDSDRLRSPGPGLAFLLAVGLISGACATTGSDGARTAGELEVVPEVDLDRFMGDWYVVGLIPNRIEKDPYLSVESYAMRDDGKIDITYFFRQGGFDGEEKTLHMVARPRDGSGARWSVRPFWPLSLAYLVIDLADDYRYTVIGHPSRNYAWIMAREKTLGDRDWQGILGRLEAQGFDPERIRRVPQLPPQS